MFTVHFEDEYGTGSMEFNNRKDAVKFKERLSKCEDAFGNKVPCAWNIWIEYPEEY